MKKSFDASSCGVSALNFSAFRSASSLRLDPLRRRRVGDRLAVLVGPGQEEHVLAALAHVARRTSAAIVVYAWPRCGCAFT